MASTEQADAGFQLLLPGESCRRGVPGTGAVFAASALFCHTASSILEAYCCYGLCNMGLIQPHSSGEDAALVSPSKPSCLVFRCQDPDKTRAASSSLTP